jgi:hypothetical protein
MPATRLESVTNWNDYSIVPGTYFWGNRELGPMVDIIHNMQDYDIMETGKSDG